MTYHYLQLPNCVSSSAECLKTLTRIRLAFHLLLMLSTNIERTIWYAYKDLNIMINVNVLRLVVNRRISLTEGHTMADRKYNG